MARANNQDALINQNSANIQRNLELIQGIQNNISGSYLEVKALLETEIAARKAEDIRLEAKIDKNTADLATEAEERKAADKALQDALDAEEAARTAADAALGVRIDTEIAERKAADKTLQDNIDAEEYARTQEDTRLNARIDKEVTDRTNADNALGTRIDTEEDAREAADTQLQTNITAEETARKAADKTLQDNIDATNAHTINTHRLDSNPVLNGTDIKLDGYSENGGTTVADLAIKATDTTSQAFGKVQKRINVDKSETDTKINKVKTAVGLTDSLELPGLDNTNYMGGSTNLVEAVKKLDLQIEPIILPAAMFNISANSTSEQIAEVLTDDVLDLIQSNRDAKKPMYIYDASGDSFYQLFPTSVQYSNNNGVVTLRAMYIHAGTEYAREFARTAAGGVWTIKTNIASRILPESDLVNDLTTGGAKKVATAEQAKVLKGLIDTETSNREAAIEDLKTEVGGDTTALEAKIDKEIKDRADQDNALHTALTNALEAGDANVMGALTREAQVREAADSALGIQITESAANIQSDLQTFKGTVNTFMGTKGQANGLASLDENGKVPASQLPSYVDDVIDVYATYDVSDTNEVTNIKLYTDAGHTTPVVGEAGKSYNDITPDHPGYQFRWSGTTWVQIVSGGLIIGEITGTAFDGAKGKALEAVANGLPINSVSALVRFDANGNNVNLHYDSASKSNGNIYKANPSSFISIPAVTTTKAGVMTAADKVKLDTTLPKQISDEVAARTAADEAIRGELADDIAQEVLDRDAAIKVAKDALQANITKEVTDRTNADNTLKTTLEKAIADAKTELETADATLQSNITKEVNDRKGEITRVEKLITDEAATRAQADIDVNEKVDLHIANKSNPHGVTKAQVGLANVNNTSDADKPVSTAQATAIADAKAAGTNAQTNLTTHIQNQSNPHNVTRDQLGMGTTSEIVFKKVSAPSGLWKESDERLKTFIKPLEHTLDEICSIPTDSFLIRGTHDIGTIAQSIEKHFPELVSENTVKPESVPNPEAFEKVEKDGETYILVKEVDYSKMSVLAIEGIKLLKQEIDELKKQLLFTNLD